MSSSRRGGHDDSILAKLEREPVRRAGGRAGVRLAWYGSAALLAVALTATLAWLAAGTGPQALEVAQAGDTRPQPSGEVRRQPGTEDVLAAPAAAPSSSALIVDAAPEPAPPLRMLQVANAKPAPARVAPPAPPIAAAVRDRKPAPAAEPRPERRPQARPESRTAASIEIRPDARPPAPRQRVATVRTPARQAARVARTINPVRTSEHDDSDVALISAVIYHANGHAAADSADTGASPCADDACRARAQRQ